MSFLPGIRSKLHSEQSLNDRHILSMDVSVIVTGPRIRGQSEDNFNWAPRRDIEAEVTLSCLHIPIHNLT